MKNVAIQYPHLKNWSEAWPAFCTILCLRQQTQLQFQVYRGLLSGLAKIDLGFTPCPNSKNTKSLICTNSMCKLLKSNYVLLSTF